MSGNASKPTASKDVLAEVSKEKMEGRKEKRKSTETNANREEYLKCQNKQLKLDVMLKQMTEHQKTNDEREKFVRVSHLDTDLEKAIKLSLAKQETNKTNLESD